MQIIVQSIIYFWDILFGTVLFFKEIILKVAKLINKFLITITRAGNNKYSKNNLKHLMNKDHARCSSKKPMCQTLVFLFKILNAIIEI
jgi:hypothetical protein